jgi:hypothetical protein
MLWGCFKSASLVFTMSLIINLGDIPSEGQTIDCEVLPSEVDLPSDDGKIFGTLNCAGQIFFPDDRMAHFQGTLTGRVARECVRCLTIFEENLFLYCDADFCQPTPSAPSPDSSKKMKKGSRRHIPPIDEAQEQDVDTYPITESQIDLVPALRESLILATSPYPLCQESCTGLCQGCGANLNEGVCGCSSSVTASSSVVSETPSMVSKNVPKPSPRLV